MCEHGQNSLANALFSPWVAEALGVEPEVVQEGKRRLRAKVRAVLAKHGLTDPKLASHERPPMAARNGT